MIRGEEGRAARRRQMATLHRSQWAVAQEMVGNQWTVGPTSAGSQLVAGLGKAGIQ